MFITPPQMHRSQHNEVIVPAPQEKDLADSKAREDAWMSIAETTVLAIAFWFDPTGTIAPFSIKLCFQILKTLRHHHRQ